jgi:ribose-phosphate pyrophosphokinase
MHPLDSHKLLVFAPQSARVMGEHVATHLKIDLSTSEEREYENGEHKMRPLSNVRDRDVYVISLLCGDLKTSSNDRLCRLLLFIGALKDAGAARVTACVPYLPYARKDRRTKANDPISTRYIAAMFEAVKTDRVVVLDVHNLGAFENAFRIPTVPLDTTALFAQHFATKSGTKDWVVASPDIGGVKRAQRLRDVLASQLKNEVGSAFMDKQRNGGVISGETLVGNVVGKRVLIVDDMISSGTTMCRAVAACRKAGATEVHLAAAHAVFQPQARQLFANPDRQMQPDGVVVTNSVALPNDFQTFLGNALTVLDIAPMYATAIAQLHASDSLADLCGL